MSRLLWLRFLAISVAFGLLLGALYALLVRELAGDVSNDVQRSMYLFIARIVEEGPYPESVRRIDRFRAESTALSMQLWVISDAGATLASSTDAAPPPWLRQIGKPRRIHEVLTQGRFFSTASAMAVVRLDAAEPTYLVIRNAGTPRPRIFLTLGLFFVATVVGAVFLGLLLVMLYLRGRSREARQVIARMEAGDLTARFHADRLDATGRLMLDFNRMADEIERLVQRLQQTERARRELLQELGHDLRTPLTSLRTAVETLAAHGDVMPATERHAFMEVVTGEFGYFRKLIDDLFFIAEIDEPRYRHAAERIDLAAVIGAEMQGMENGRCGAAHQIRCGWRDLPPTPGRHLVAGDPHLITRLFRNLFDNTARHARSAVQVGIASNDGFVEVRIEDDGAGMTPAAMAAFGQRRSRRILAGNADFAASLGLGSVIVRTIVELHGGRLALESSPEAGTCITVSLPEEARAPIQHANSSGDTGLENR